MAIDTWDDVFELLRLTSLCVFTGASRSEAEERRLWALLEALRQGACPSECDLVLEVDGIELGGRIKRVLATGFCLETPEQVAPGTDVRVTVHVDGELDYVFVCRCVVANRRTGEHGLMLTELPTVELPFERWERATRTGGGCIEAAA